MSYVALQPPDPGPATPVVPAFQFYSVMHRGGAKPDIRIYPGGGPFDATDYAEAAGISVETAEAVLAQALTDGKIAFAW